MTVLTPPPAPPVYPGPPQAPYPPPYYGPPGPPAPRGPLAARPGNRNSWVIGIIAVVVALVAAIVAVVVVTSGNNNKLAAPTGVRLVAVTGTSATIAWNPAAGTLPTRYAIYRNDTQIDTVPGAVERTTDTGLAPLTTYRYQVAAYQDGSWSDHSAAVAVTTKAASLADASLNHSYDVNLRVLKEYGYTHISPGDSDAETWYFKEKADGSVILFGNVSGGSWKMHLTKVGRTYTGLAHETLSQCNITPVNTALSVKLHVLKGGLVNGAWAATQFRGTYKQAAPYTTSGLYTCPGAGYNASVAGHVVR